MMLCSDAQFRELTVTDLILISALNEDYLLTLPIYDEINKDSIQNYKSSSQAGNLK